VQVLLDARARHRNTDAVDVSNREQEDKEAEDAVAMLHGWSRDGSPLCHKRRRARRNSSPSGLSTLNKDQIAERGARMARRDD
jgi:hypothetical protein